MVGSQIQDHFGYVEYNLQIPGISYNSDRVTLVAEDNTPFSKEVPLTIGTKTEDTILEALKEGEIEMLDSVWKRVKNNRLLSKLREVRIQEAVIQVAKSVPDSKTIHTPYSNWGREDLLELNKLASATRMEIIPPWSNKTIKARTPLVLTGTSMNMMTKPLHQNDKALPWGLRVCPSYGMYNCGSWKTTVQLHNTKDHTTVIKEGTAVARMVAANEVPGTVVADSTVGALWTQSANTFFLFVWPIVCLLVEGFLPVSLSSEVCAGLGNGCERFACRDLC